MGYEKFTFKAFQQKLESGGYDELKGANRAVGKMGGWSEKERDKAREIARAHFGDTAVATVKGAKKVKTAKTKVKAEKVAKTKEAAPKKVSKTRGPKAEAAPARAPRKARAASNTATSDRLEQVNSNVNTVRQSLESMDLARRLGAPDADVAAGAKKAQQLLIQSIDALGSFVSQLSGGVSEAEMRAAEAFEKATIAGGNGIKSIVAVPRVSATPATPPTQLPT